MAEIMILNLLFWIDGINFLLHAFLSIFISIATSVAWSKLVGFGPLPNAATVTYDSSELWMKLHDD